MARSPGVCRIFEVMIKKRNCQLLVSIVILVPIALCYGILPDIALPGIFHFRLDTVDIRSVFRATMGLYLGVVAILVIGVAKPRFWATATLTNVCFFGGLAFGRLLSLVFDGVPSMVFLLGLVAEFGLTLWGLSNLKKYGGWRG